MTLIEVIDVARQILNEPLDSSRVYPDNSSGFWNDDLLQNYFNLTQQEVQQELVQTFEDYFITDTTLNISAGQNRYAVPSDFLKMRRMEDIRNGGTPREILPTRLNLPNQAFGFNISSGGGFGHGYHIEADSIVFDNTPSFTDDSAVRLYYIKRLADVTAASDTSEIPDEHHRVLVWGVVKHALYQQQSENNFALVEFEKHLSRMNRQAETRQVQRPRKVVRRKTDHDGGVA